MSQMVASEFGNTYEQYAGLVVEALVIGERGAVRRHGRCYVLNHETLVIGGDVVPTWTILTIKRGTSPNTRRSVSTYDHARAVQTEAWL